MKRVRTIAFSMLMICCILLGTVVIVQATEPGYDIKEAYNAEDVTIDGQNGGDWDPNLCWFENITSDAEFSNFAYKMASTSPLYMAWIIEFPDNTDNASDVWQICLDGAPATGGGAPTTDCNKIEVTGHSTLTVYVGDGSGWVEMQGADVQWAETLQTTTIWGEPAEEHYVLEIKADKNTLGGWGVNQPPQGLRVAMYDANNDTQGWIAWPPTEADVPDEWGLISSAVPTVPESFSLGVVLLLTTVAIVVGFYVTRKRPKKSISYKI